MAAPIPFHYFIASLENPVTLQNPIHDLDLPLNRHQDSSQKITLESSITYGEYFKAITVFLSRDRFESLIGAVKACFGYSLEETGMDEIRVFLMKHGEFYHPAKVEIYSGVECFNFVVNVAVSKNGLEYIEAEFGNLKAMEELYPYAFIPRVFDSGGAWSGRDVWIPMFLGEWFEGFHEFHYSEKQGNEDPGLRIWDDRQGPYFLDEVGALDIFTRASAILTSYYDFFSSRHIAAWHHAAGDFVVCFQENITTVKLITVRQYIPLVRMDEPDLGSLLDAMVLFFLNLSVRMRLDRLDGVKDTFWIGEPAVMGAVKGFFSGLGNQISSKTMPEELVAGFKAYLGSFKPEDLLDWSRDMVERLFKDNPDLEIIKSHLEAHVLLLHGYTAQELGR
ncbi:MAG: hypothetical protein FP816_03535 [Desulfobacteraceae bacterium]|nr:hypothetical protein [Desulfobacteraceae bacterium]MBU4053896.1 hypothetical protein [Pseudomonadota bacterium]